MLAVALLLTLFNFRLSAYEETPPGSVDALSVKPSHTIIGTFETLTIDMGLAAEFQNPFDPGDIKVDAIIEPPTGNPIPLPCFFLSGESGGSWWRGRFTPQQTGAFTYRVAVRADSGKLESPAFKLNVTESGRDGFLRPHPYSKYLFHYDSGKPFRGLGENFGWESQARRGGEKKRYSYESMFEILESHGCNFTRTWMCPWNLPLEWKKEGLGRYDLETAERLDRVLELAERHGIHIMLALDYHGVLVTKPDYWGGNIKWVENPYNKANGGPCATPREFFTDPTAKKMYRRRLRYLVARWGHSPALAAWEFFNEMENISRDPGFAADMVAWHREMASYVKRLDPYGHMVTTSAEDFPGLWDIADFDLTQTHRYRPTDDLPDIVDAFNRKYPDKHHVVGEFAYDWRGPGETGHPELYELELHLGLWRGLFSPTPVLPLTWWWDHHEPRGEYRHFSALAPFLKGTLKADQGLAQPLGEDPDPVQVRVVPEKASLIKNFELFPTKQFSPNAPLVFTVDRAGKVAHETAVPAHLFSPQAKADYRNPPAFRVNYRADGAFHVHVGEVSGQNTLRVLLDGEPVLEKFLPLGEGEGEWEKSALVPKWNNFQGAYNKKYGFPVPKGPHTIQVENTTGDWIHVRKYEFENCGIDAPPPAEIRGFRVGDEIFLWINNRANNSKRVLTDGPPHAVENALLVLTDMKKGRYTLRFYDTTHGFFHDKTTIRLPRDGSELRAKLPAFSADFALRITRH